MLAAAPAVSARPWIHIATFTLAAALAALIACGRADSSAPQAPPAAPASAPAPERPAKLHAALAFSTYWGSQGGSALRSISIDGEGNLYVVGGTKNPQQWPQTAPASGPLGFFDVIVAKFAPDGRNLWSRVIGGSGEDYAYVSALDREGNLVVGGRSGPDFPVTPGAYDTSFGGGRGRGPHEPTDGFVMSLSPAGELRWATYVGSSGDDITRAIQILPDGGIAVSGGNTDRGDLPTTPGVVKPKLGGKKDAWIAVLEPDGSRVRFLSYVGPSDDVDTGDETLRAIGWDAHGSLWIAGTTDGTDLVASADAFQPLHGGGGSAFVAKLSPDGQRMPYLSWLGGSGGENIETEGLSDAAGAFYLAGGSSSADFPATQGAERGSPEGGDGLVARIEPDGRLGMAARFGGSGPEDFFGPAIDGSGSVFATGTTGSVDLPVTAGAFQPRHAGDRTDALLVAFDAAGALELSTYFGGSGKDTGRFVAADPARRRLAIVGETTSEDLPLRNAAQAQPGATYLAVFELARDASPASPPAVE